MEIFFKFTQTRYQISLREICARARPRSFVAPLLRPCPLGLRDGLREIKKYFHVRFIFLFILLLSVFGCALFRPAVSTDDPLLNFYPDTPPAHTQAALKLTEKAREELRATHYDVATEHLQKALMIDPQCPFPYYFLAVISHQAGDFKKSNGFLEKAKQLSFPFPFWRAQSYTLSGQNFESLGNKKMARMEIKKAKEIDPNL